MIRHFNVDNIDYINFIPRSKSEYEWYPALPRKTFLYFFTDYKAVEAGWSDSARGSRVSEIWLKRHGYIYVSPTKGNIVDYDGGDLKVTPNGSWDNKSYVYVRTKETDHSRYFDNDENALTWIDDLKSMTKSKFSIIERD